jgi:hypothetical protein
MVLFSEKDYRIYKSSLEKILKDLKQKADK